MKVNNYLRYMEVNICFRYLVPWLNQAIWNRNVANYSGPPPVEAGVEFLQSFVVIIPNLGLLCVHVSGEVVNFQCERHI